MTTTERRVVGGRYALLKRIGAGGMADVFKAEDRVLGRHVAVKILSQSLAGDPAFVARFRREARAAAALNHPNIVTVYDWGVDGRLYFMVMELVEGETLEDVLQRRERLPEPEALRIAENIAGALQAAHRQGVVHRDVKPHNVLIGHDGQLKVADFGIARALGAAQITDAGTVFGTAQYISPEQAQNEPVDARSDLYGLGVVLYEMLTGQVPFTGDSPMAIAWQHVHQPPEAPRRLVPSISPAASALVLRALEKNPAARFQSAAEMRDAISQILGGERQPTVSSFAPGPDGRGNGPTQVVPVLAGTALADATRPVWVASGIPLEPAAPARAAPAAGVTVAGRPRATATGRIAAGLRLIALLLLVCPAALAAALFVFRPDVGTALARAAVRQVAGFRVASPQRLSPAASPSPPVTNAPAQTPQGTAPPQAARPTSAPATAARPTPLPPTVAPPTPVPPTKVPAVAAGDPAQAVINFYTLAAEHKFEQAAQLWSARMQASYPPDVNIDHRFAATRSISVNSARVVSIDQGAGTATVAVDLTEASGDPPPTRRWTGTWALVRGPSGWLLDQPNLQQAS